MIASKAERAQLSEALHEQIAMARFLNVRIAAFEEERLELAAPLAPTLNHRGVAFGPGVLTTAALAPWLLLVRWAWARRVRARIVLRRSEFEMHRPIDRDFRAVCDRLPQIDLDQFTKTGKARFSAAARVVFDDGDPAAVYSGHFALVQVPEGAPEGDLTLPFPPRWRP
jgi:thioesterase domain-containing protein